jgi:tetratricopeptide (TPR) repeat protein
MQSRCPKSGTDNPSNRAVGTLFLPALVGLLALMTTACGSSAPSGRDVQAYFDAKELYLRGDTEAAVPQLEALTARAKSFHQARLLLGKALFMSGRHAEAAETFAALLREYPRYADASLWQARSLMAAGSLKEAEDALTEAMAYSSEDSRFLYAAGSLWECRGEYQKALDYYRRAAVAGDELGEIYLSIGKIYSRFRVYDKSLQYIDKCLSVLDEGSLLYRPVVELKARVQEEMKK